jgi:tripartite-type tricarboxylate transporter receptor subunit TctC
MRQLLPKLGLGLLVGAALPLAALADPVEDFYKGKEIHVIIHVAADSNYGRWAQLMAPYMPRHIPGKPTIVVQSMPGAGGLLADNFLYNQAPKDGTYYGSHGTSMVSQLLIGTLQNANLDPTKFAYIGSPFTSPNACIARSDKLKSLEDAQKREVPMAGAGPTTTQSFVPKLANQLIGTKFKVIEGYQSSGETLLAVERGEVDGTCANTENFIRNPPVVAKLDKGEYKLLFVTSQKRYSPLKDIPTLFEHIKSEENKQLLAFIMAGAELGRPYFAPPGVPADRLAALRKGFADTLKDPDFLADIAKQKLVVEYTSGDELAQVVKGLYATPKPIVEKAAELMPKD